MSFGTTWPGIAAGADNGLSRFFMPAGQAHKQYNKQYRARDKSKPDPNRTRFPTENTKPHYAKRMAAKYSLTPEKVCEALVLDRGLIADAALRLGVARGVLYKYIADRPLCAATLKDAREAMGDVAERKLFELIEAGDVRCIMYYLSTVHKARGYGVKRDDSLFENRPQVTAINIVSVPPGQYLSSDEIQRLSIESQLANAQPIAPAEIDLDTAEWSEPVAEPEPRVVESCLD